MRHIDEHTIELYILGSDLGAEQISEIETHCKECYGCRTLADEIRGFYKDLEESLDTLLAPEGQKSNALMKLPSELLEYDIPFGSRVPFKPMTPLGKFFYFVYKHPIPAAMGGVATMALLGAALFFGINDLFKDNNPAYTHLNSESAIVEVYNKQNEKLWSFPSKAIYRVEPEDYTRLSREVIVADFDSDGKNEVITLLPVGSRINSLPPLTIFSSTGKAIKEVKFNEKIQFRGTQYAEGLGVQDIICDVFENEGEKQLIVITNNGRSPSVIYRLAIDGSELGAYFHFGVGKISVIEVGNDRKKRIAFLGRNDVNDPDSLGYAVLTILDPMKIVGKTEASDSRGFGLPLGTAEEYIIRFPLSDLNYILKSDACASGIQSIQFNGIPSFQVDLMGNYQRKENVNSRYPVFWYIFKSDLSIVEVKYEAMTNRIRQELVEQGKCSGKIDSLYLSNLKNGVTYWNGKEWQKEPAMVRHDYFSYSP
jgi:hypothetical protein